MYHSIFACRLSMQKLQNTIIVRLRRGRRSKRASRKQQLRPKQTQEEAHKPHSSYHSLCHLLLPQHVQALATTGDEDAATLLKVLFLQYSSSSPSSAASLQQLHRDDAIART
jgi:hypothetical protein